MKLRFSIFYCAALVTGLASCKTIGRKSSTKESFSGSVTHDGRTTMNMNDPKFFELKPVKHGTILDDGPQEVRLDKSHIPWSGDYWASANGGITKRWNGGQPSPAEKYDSWTGTSHVKDFVLKNLKENAPNGRVDEIPSWWGICHGWSPASIYELDPGTFVKVKGADGQCVEFKQGDLKGLVSQAYANSTATTQFIGFRCNDEKPAADGGGRPSEIQCRDTNPGALLIVLHSLLTNNKSFVGDFTYSDQVWNQPVSGYKIISKSNLIDCTPMRNCDPIKRGNPAMRYYRDVEMDISYVVETSPSVSSLAEKTGRYKFQIEIAKDGTIIGGDWAYPSPRIDSATQGQPDFLWRYVDEDKILSNREDVGIKEIRKLIWLSQNDKTRDGCSQDVNDSYDGSITTRHHADALARRPVAPTNPVEEIPVVVTPPQPVRPDVPETRVPIVAIEPTPRTEVTTTPTTPTPVTVRPVRPDRVDIRPGTGIEPAQPIPAQPTTDEARRLTEEARIRDRLITITPNENRNVTGVTPVGEVGVSIRRANLNSYGVCHAQTNAQNCLKAHAKGECQWSNAQGCIWIKSPDCEYYSTRGFCQQASWLGCSWNGTSCKK